MADTITLFGSDAVKLVRRKDDATPRYDFQLVYFQPIGSFN